MSDSVRPEDAERGVCGKCGDEYIPYVVLVTDDFTAMTNWMSIKRRFGYVCPDCFRDEPCEGLAIIGDPTVDGSQEAYS